MTYARMLAKKRERNQKMIAEYIQLGPDEHACSIYRRHRISKKRFYEILGKYGVPLNQKEKPA